MTDLISKTTAPNTHREKTKTKGDKLDKTDKDKVEILSKFEKHEKIEKAWEKDSGFLWEELKYIDNLSITKNKDINKELLNEFDNYESNQLLDLINEKISYEPIFLRGLIIIVDFDENISKRSTIFTPNKLDYLKEKLLEIGKLYYERNFLSSISIIATSDYTAKAIIISCYDFKSFSNELNESWPKTGYGSGSFSFYNSLYYCAEMIRLFDNDLKHHKTYQKFLNYEVLLIANSINTYDSFSCLNIIKQYYLDLKIEINIFSFEFLNSIFKDSSLLTGGLSMRGKSSDDFISFGNYICFKKFKANKQFMIIDRFKLIVYNNVVQKKNFCGCHDEFHEYCFECHCKVTYCSVPVLCKYCGYILFDKTYFELFKDFVNKTDFLY